MYKSPVAIVTGAGGFIGANLTRALLKKHWRIYAVVHGNSVPWRLTDIQTKITLVPGGLDSKDRLIALLRNARPDVIFHLATYGAYPAQTDISAALATNIGGIVRLLEAVLDVCPSVKVVVTGSSSEYGKKVHPMKETDILEPNSVYAATKAAQTHIALVYAIRNAMHIKILRLFNVYGPYEESGRLVRNAIEAALSDRPIRLSDAGVARDFIHTDDVSAALIASVRSPRGWDGQIYNVGTGRETTIGQLARTVVRLIKSKSTIETGSYAGRVWDTKHWKADMTKTNRIMHWRAKTSLTAGLKKTIAWYTK